MPAFEGELMTFGNNMHEIYYNEDIPQNEVKIVGQELISFGYFNTREKQAVQLTVENNNYILKILVPKEWWDDKDILESLESLRIRMSNSLNRSNINIIMLAGTLKGIEEKELNLENF